MQDATAADQEPHPTLQQFIKHQEATHGHNGPFKLLEIKLHSKLTQENIFQDVTAVGEQQHTLIQYLSTSPHLLEIHMHFGLQLRLEMEYGPLKLIMVISYLDAITA